MSIVLWNAGLMSGLRRYGEMGMRLAMGEKKGHVYCSLIYESVSIGTVSSILGIALGMGICYWLQEAGLDISSLMKGSTAVISDIVRAKVTPSGFFIGFIPGLLSTVFGSLVSGIGIFKRQTSQLFKELET
jgi:putative ABC transport system permease protein